MKPFKPVQGCRGCNRGSATMAITLIMLDQQWISFDMGAAMVLGENIGTTITANVAAAMGNTDARRAAIAHTIFNAINTLVLIGFTSKIEAVVRKIIPDGKVPDEDAVHLRYLSAGPVATPELGAQQALMETIHFATVSQKEVDIIGEAVYYLDTKEFEGPRARLVKYEEISDRMEQEIAAFLTSLMENETSQQTSRLSKAMFRIISELESLGDSGECISRILFRFKESGETLSPERRDGISRMLYALRKAYDTMIDNLKAMDKDDEEPDMDEAIEDERAINMLRDHLRDEEFARIEAGRGPYANSTLYLDVIAEIERMGDYIINISQAVQRAK